MQELFSLIEHILADMADVMTIITFTYWLIQMYNDTKKK